MKEKKNKRGKIVEVVSSTLTNQEKREATAIKMIMDPEFYLEQTELMLLYKVLTIALDDVNNRLQEGLFAMKYDKQIQQLVQNAATSNRRLLDAILKDKEHDFGHNSEIFDDAANIALSVVDVLRFITSYMTDPADQWRQVEFNKCLNRLIPQEVIDEKVAKTEELLQLKYADIRKEIKKKAV